MSIGKVTFTHNFLNESKKKSFRVNEHPSVLRAQIIAPNESMLFLLIFTIKFGIKFFHFLVQIGAQQCFLVRIFTGLSRISEGKLTLEAMSEGLSFPRSDKYHSITRPVISKL